jgi:hypothetical protein
MKTIFSLGGIIVFIFLSACSENEGDTGYKDKDGNIRLKYSELQRASDDGLFLEITDIADSRCPLGVICNTEGSVKISLNARESEDITSFSLELGDISSHSHTVDTIMDYRVELINVLPYPTGSSFEPNDYIAIVNVEKL